MIILGLALIPIALQAQDPAIRTRTSFDSGWHFKLGEEKQMDPVPDGATFSYFAKAGTAGGAAADSFNDSTWDKVDLPHDWAVALPFSDLGSNSHGSKAIGRNFPQNSIGWYRKQFSLPATDKGRRVQIEFDGVFRDSQVWVNGFYLGRNSSGYDSFGYDMSDYLNFGGKNTIAVRVDASLEEGWFYEGAGIYRHVWLTETDPLHVARWGTYVTSQVKGRSADVTDRITVQNDADDSRRFDVLDEVFDPQGRKVAVAKRSSLTLGPGSKTEVSTKLGISNAGLWSPESPALYQMVTTVLSDGKPVDRYKTSFGIRTLQWDPNLGFFLNGKHVQLKGVCDHQDHAGVGVAVPDGLDAWRLSQLKKMGVNALRTSHNPPNPSLLDACDRMGILVMDENRETGINPQQLDGLRSLIQRDRNHPSVILWSLGNEEWTIEGNERGARVTSRMQAFAKALDPTRLATVAISGGWGNGSSNTIDVMGFNYYTHGNTDDFHKKFPLKPSVGTEDGSTLSTRGIYVTDRAKGHLSAYDVNAPDWASTASNSWNHYLNRPYSAGQFQWTGFDYRGEPTPFGWPSISSQFGILDLCGFPKDNFYYYQAWWSGKPVLHILPHWNWSGREGQPIDVWVHGNTDEVELALNGTSLGRKTMPRNGHLEWKVPYAPGTLTATGFTAGKPVLTDKVETSGPPVSVRLSVVDPDVSGDVAVVAVSAVDAEGRPVPNADVPINFELSGPGRILGVGNGDPSSHEPDQAVTETWSRSLFSGLAEIIVQAKAGEGAVVLTATSPNLKVAVLRLPIKRAESISSN